MQHLLRRFPVIETFSASQMQQALESVWGARAFEVERGEREFHAVANHWQAGPLGISYCCYDAGAEAIFPPGDFVRQQICLSGSASTACDWGETGMRAGDLRVVNPSVGIRARFRGGFRQLVFRVDTSALSRKLAALSGAAVKGRLEFSPTVDLGNPAAGLFRDTVMLLVKHLDADAGLPDAVISEMSQTIMVALLHGSKHNFSRALDRPAPVAAPWQVRRAEEYIEANWDRPVDIEQLAAVANCSARSLFKTFRDARGCSPMAFVKAKRLEHAHGMLRKGDPRTSVVAVAFACGFLNAGHFARDYRRAFGELPSVTLRRAKGMQ